MIRNLHFENIGELTDYPLDEAASRVDDAGVRLPTSLIADLNLRWPATLGRYAFLSAVSVTDGLVTVVLQAAETVDAVSGFTPLAVVAVLQPVERYRVYPLQAQAAGVGGWIVFGDGVTGSRYRGRFSGPAQARLVPRAARAYRPLPVTGLGVLGADQLLTGLVTLRAEQPLALAREEREIAGVLRDVLVLRLTDDSGSDDTPAPATALAALGATTPSVFQQFAGPCGGRPESRTCGPPEPIEFINAVGPDCTGTLTIELRGCATVARFVDRCGVLVDCEVSLDEACAPKQLPSSAGVLPDEAEPVDIIPPTPPFITPAVSDSEFFIDEPALPYTDCFLDGDATDFEVARGQWAVIEGLASPAAPCPEAFYPASGSVSFSDTDNVGFSVVSQSLGQLLVSYATRSAASRNVTLWRGRPEDPTNYRRVSTDLYLLNDDPTAHHFNGSLVLNYRADLVTDNVFVYYLAELDWNAQQVRIRRFDGVRFLTIEAVDVPGLAREHWYHLEATVMAGALGGQTLIVVHLTSITSPGSVDVAIGTTVSDYHPSNGVFGFGTDRALTAFSYFKLEVVQPE